ncbi:hypothetical protein AB0C67_48530, partial [Streptomyces sp. NPDC048665]
MPSVVGLLEQRELSARRRVDELREEADRVQAELAVAEREWKEWAIACSRVGEVLAPMDESGQDPARPEGTAPAAEEQTGKKPLNAGCRGIQDRRHPIRRSSHEDADRLRPPG